MLEGDAVRVHELRPSQEDDVVVAGVTSRCKRRPVRYLDPGLYPVSGEGVLEVFGRLHAIDGRTVRAQTKGQARPRTIAYAVSVGIAPAEFVEYSGATGGIERRLADIGGKCP